MPKSKHSVSKKNPRTSSRQTEPAVQKVQATPPNRFERLAAWLGTARGESLFVKICLGVLAATTIFWSVLSAALQEANADQFIDTYLFESPGTFHSALFPGAHTFLIKWPIFALMQLFGRYNFIFIFVTILMVLTTVAVLVYVLYKIERRPLVFGMLCLLLSSVMLFIPAQPYAGALLPVNMAMTTTRNLEYALFVWCLYRLTSVGSIKSHWFWGLMGLLALVIASDKLFAVLAIGSALVVLAGYVGLLRRRYETGMYLRWLLMSVLAFGLANIILFALSALRITHIVDEISASPFSSVHHPKQLAEGLIYGVGAILTNFGANPVHHVIMIREIPGALLRSLASTTIIGYLFNCIVLMTALRAAVSVVRSRMTDAATRLTVLLSGSLLAALIVFVLTDHYYPVDARYVAIELFTLFVALAAYARSRQFNTRYIVICLATLVVVLPLGMVRSWQEFSGSRSVLSIKNTASQAAAEILNQRHIGRLIGDYWDVTPVKAHGAHKVTIAPVENCYQPRQALNSMAWFKAPNSTPAAYLAVRDAGKQTYQGCSLERLATLYGTPTERVTLATDAAPPHDPNVLLLLYANGLNPLTAQKPAPAPTPTLPPEPPKVTSLRDKTVCRSSTLVVVAHQDDDLLFINPDVAADIKNGNCMRTVYLTAGDAGQPFGYWNGREQGAKAAYAQMYNLPNVWHDQRELLAGRFVTVSYLDGAPGLGLVFLRLPDGNTHGEGFPDTKFESLAHMMQGIVPELHTIDDGTAYTKDQLVASLTELMTIDRSDQIRTLAMTDPTASDHSDHLAVGELTRQASVSYKQVGAIQSYTGYPTKMLPVNLFDEPAISKENTFLAYAKYDGAVCQTDFECRQTYTYGSYLIRLYEVDAPLTP